MPKPADITSDEWIAALKRERASYEAGGRADRAADVDAEIKRLTSGRGAAAPVTATPAPQRTAAPTSPTAPAAPVVERTTAPAKKAPAKKKAAKKKAAPKSDVAPAQPAPTLEPAPTTEPATAPTES